MAKRTRTVTPVGNTAPQDDYALRTRNRLSTDFLEMMQDALVRNYRAKGAWMNWVTTVFTATIKIAEHAAKLQRYLLQHAEDLKLGKSNNQCDPAIAVAAADLANYAMMIGMQFGASHLLDQVQDVLPAADVANAAEQDNKPSTRLNRAPDSPPSLNFEWRRGMPNQPGYYLVVWLAPHTRRPILSELWWDATLQKFASGRAYLVDHGGGMFIYADRVITWCVKPTGEDLTKAFGTIK